MRNQEAAGTYRIRLEREWLVEDPVDSGLWRPLGFPDNFDEDEVAAKIKAENESARVVLVGDGEQVQL